MTVYALGASHRATPVHLREQLVYSPRTLEVALARVGCGRAETALPLAELVILSTCNRVELYATLVHAVEGTVSPWPLLEGFLAETTGAGALAEAALYRLEGPQAARHLCRVACGLDSMVLGESEILGQVADALKVAQRQGAAGPVTAALFRAAIRAGKRARTETPIGCHAASVSSIAVKHATDITGPLEDKVVVVVGAGRMGWKTAAAFRARGAGTMLVVNRTRDRSEELAAEWQAAACSLEELPAVIAKADIVVTSTGAPHSVISMSVVREAIEGRGRRPLVIVDIAVPRDVERGVAALPGVHVVDIDALEASLDTSVEARRQAVPAVEAIVQEAVHDFATWESSVALLPVIDSIRRGAEDIRRREVARLLAERPDLDHEVATEIEGLSHRLVNEVLRAPTATLRNEAENGHAAQFAEIARRLFALEPPPDLSEEQSAP